MYASLIQRLNGLVPLLRLDTFLKSCKIKLIDAFVFAMQYFLAKGAPIMKKSVLIVFFLSVLVSLAIALTGWLSAFSPQQVKKVIKSPQTVKEVAEFPVITEFTIIPESIIYREKHVNITFKWRVRPGIGGSGITNINIRKTSGKWFDYNIRSTKAEGEVTYTIPEVNWWGDTVYTLAATSGAEKSATKSAVLKVSSWDAIRNHLTIASFKTEPPEISRTSGPYIYILKIKNNSSLTVSHIHIRVQEHRTTLSPALSGQKIKPGMNEWRLNVSHWSGCPHRLRVLHKEHSQEPFFDLPIVCEEIKYYKFRLGY